MYISFSAPSGSLLRRVVLLKVGGKEACVFLFVCQRKVGMCETRILIHHAIRTSATRDISVFVLDAASCMTVQMVHVSCQLSDGASPFKPGRGNMCLLLGDITTHRRI